MGKRVLAALMTTVLVCLSLGASGMFAGPAAASAAPATRFVSPWGNDTSGQGTEASPWRTIGYAVSRASAGDTVKLMDDDNEATDDYVEKVVVDKSLTITRYDHAGPNPQVRGLGENVPVFSIAADNVTVSGLDICVGPEEGAGNGISLYLCQGCTIEENRIGWDSDHIAGAWFGVEIAGGGHNQIRGNTFSRFGFYGLRVVDSHFNSICSNVLSNCPCSQGAAVFLQDSTNNGIVRNAISRNLCPGIVLLGGSDDNNAVYLNRVSDNGDPGYMTNTGYSTWHSPEQMTYTYNSATWTGYLGNYWDGYSGVDDGSDGKTAGDGVGDTELPYAGFSACDCYPLVDGSAGAYLLPGEVPPLDPPAQTVAHTTFYVSPWGNDTSGQGTEDSPWRTIGYAVSRAAPGDTVKLMDDDNEATDDYVEDVAVDKTLTIRRYNNSGPNPRVRGLGGNKPVFRVSADDTTVAGLDIYSTPLDGQDAPFSVELACCHRCRVESNRLGWDTNHPGGDAAAVRILGGGDNEIRDNLSRYFGMHGVYVCGSHSNVIRNNVLSDSRFVWGAGIWLHDSPSNAIVGNTLSRNRSPGIVVYLGSQDNVIYLNRLIDNLDDDAYISCQGSLWHSPEPVEYVYGTETYSGYLGNYYDTYSGLDDGSNGRTAGDGVGDTWLPHCVYNNDDDYPLVDASPDAYRLSGEDTSTPTPTASFSASVTSGVAPVTITFTNQSQGGELTSWHWDFGDGQTSEWENPSHAYETAGVYTVSLTVTNTSGSHSITRQQYITAIDDPLGQTVPSDADAPVQTQEGTITPVPPVEAATGTALVIKRLQPDGAPVLTSRLLVRAASGSAASPGSLVCRFGGTFFTVEGADGPDGQASITAAYSDADLDAAGADPDRLTLSYYDETRGEWVIVDTAVDTSSRTLTATSSHSGKWAVMAKPAPAANSSGFHLRYWALAGAAALVLTIMVLVGFRHRLTTR